MKSLIKITRSRPWTRTAFVSPISSGLELFKKFILDFLYPSRGVITNLSPEELLEKARRAEECQEKDVLAIFDYREPDVKKLIWELKYKNSEQAADILAKVLYQEMLGSMEDWLTFDNFKNPILIPIPLSKEKLAKRGYNQTEIVVRKIMEMDEGKNFTAQYQTLEKIKDTPDQTSTKTKEERLKNLKGSFAVNDGEEIKERNIIIIDDVITTGATIKESRRTLKANGAKKVKAVVIAH